MALFAPSPRLKEGVSEEGRPLFYVRSGRGISVCKVDKDAGRLNCWAGELHIIGSQLAPIQLRQMLNVHFALECVRISIEHLKDHITARAAFLLRVIGGKRAIVRRHQSFPEVLEASQDGWSR
jgi:hypothetical protein